MPITPPPVLLRKTSSARRSEATGSSASRTAMPLARASSMTVRREMPSSTPAAGVISSPSTSAKTLKPGPSVMLPAPSTSTAVSAPCS